MFLNSVFGNVIVWPQRRMTSISLETEHNKPSTIETISSVFPTKLMQKKKKKKKKKKISKHKKRQRQDTT